MTEAEAPAPEVETPETPAAPSVEETLQAEITALKDRLLRAAAEADNTRKRAVRDVEEASKYATTGFARDMVNVAENLQRALSTIPDAERNSPLYQGVDMTLKELLNIFERHGIKRIDPHGQKFDHNFHQAVAQLDAPNEEAGTVVQVLQAGYTIHDRLLRPAMVGVAKGTPKQVDTSA